MTDRDQPRSDVSLLDFEDRPWAAFGSCRGADPDLFFPGSEGDPREGLRICSGCPVADECLDWALETRIHYGIWGGMTERQRRRLLRRSA
ncbi:MAG: WhiB family transcriptional regulator [Actinobacteria bacterium]|nr:WhiB family transcriptional regulator [Actinomycetota bacterium]